MKAFGKQRLLDARFGWDQSWRSGASYECHQESLSAAATDAMIIFSSKTRSPIRSRSLGVIVCLLNRVQVLASLIVADEAQDIVCDVGMYDLRLKRKTYKLNLLSFSCLS